jgi:hypothetical protein
LVLCGRRIDFILMASRDTRSNSSHDSIAPEVAVQHNDVVEDVDFFVPSRTPKVTIGEVQKSTCLLSSTLLSCEMPSSMLAPCSRCSGFCVGDVFLYKDKVFCSTTCRDGLKAPGEESLSRGKLRRRPSSTF